MSSIVAVIVVLLLCVAVLGVYSAWRWRKVASGVPRVVLTGGGTGGHVNPALAIAEGILRREPECRFLYIGVRGKAEGVIVRRVGYPLKFVSSEGFPGLRPSLRLIRFLFRLSVGSLQSIWILARFAPRWVIATGGYVSAPVIVAALVLRLLRISPTKIFLHEQNSIPGQLNGFLGRWVDRVLLTFPQTLSFFPGNGVVVGYPVRHSIALKDRADVLERLKFRIPEGRQVIFAFGGSQGARTINRALVDSLRYLLPHRDRLFIIHGMGLARTAAYDAAADTESRIEASLSPEERALLDDFYYRQDYFHNIEDIYSVSDLIVCRSGAGSLNEICQLGKPAVLIPKANLPGDHQVMNARTMKHFGAAYILFEDVTIEDGQMLEKVDGHVLAERVLRLLQNPARLAEMASRSRQFLRRKSIERILSELYQDRRYDNGVGYHVLPLRPLLSNHQLLQVLARAYSGSPQTYDPLHTVDDEDDLDYYRHRVAGLLSHDTWQDRNLGGKLIGYTRYEEKIPALLHMLVDRTPVSGIRRFFGGDFEQVGFIRRNAVYALQVMNQFNAEIEQHLLTAADDPYYEVRAQVCRSAAHFGRYLAGKEIWVQTLMRLLSDTSFEVSVEAAKAIGEVGADGRALNALLELRDNKFWQVRDAGLKGIRRLVDRRVISSSPELLSQIASFILTATDFRPHFSIKETYKTIEIYCRERMMAETNENTAQVLPDSMVRKQ